MLNPDKTLQLAAHVALEAEKLGIKTALIGAAALAVHGYTRGTEDIDLAAAVLPLGPLSKLAQVLQDAGLHTELRLPDEDDPLGGVPARTFHTDSTAAVDTLAVERCAPSRELDVVSATPSLPIGPRTAPQRRLVGLATNRYEMSGLVISESESHSDVVEVVNFLNPMRCTPNPAAQAIARAFALDGMGLHCVAVADLIALKLYAGGLTDLADIVQLLAHNPDIDLAELRAIAGPYDTPKRLEELIAESSRIR